MNDLISRQTAIDALKNDMASLDHIIKGMSAYDVRLDAYVSQRNQVNCDIDTINNLPPVQPELGTNLAEVGTDLISRRVAIKTAHLPTIEDAGYEVIRLDDILTLPPAQPEPCEDAVSRKDCLQALSHLMDVEGFRDGWAVSRAKVECMLKAMPSVMPKQRTGKWIKKHRHYGGFRSYTGFDAMGEQHTVTVDERTEYDDLYCSECGARSADNFLNFCPNCGAKMTEGDAE